MEFDEGIFFFVAFHDMCDCEGRREDTMIITRGGGEEKWREIKKLLFGGVCMWVCF